jgi:hypothetical protein
MREVHLRNVDLNLLHALHALLEERHVSHAAKRSLGFNEESFYKRGAEKVTTCPFPGRYSPKHRSPNQDCHW